MQKKTKVDSPQGAESCYLPDFCSAETIFRLVLVLELVAIVLTFASLSSLQRLFIELAQVSVFVQWTGLLYAATICPLRKLGWMSSTWLVTILSFAIVFTLIGILSVAVFYFAARLGFELFDSSSAGELLLRHEIIGLVLVGLALRYFYVQHHALKMVRAESGSRLQALQARIRPHFLFNSLNTIASLTYDQPEKAESAIEGLADLFRASLQADARISLQQEIEFTREYIALEKLRLGDRLQVEWKIDAPTDTCTLPALTMQPLVENAIYHGIEPLTGGGCVVISIRQRSQLEIMISNPVSIQKKHMHRKGNRMAVDNIRQRLQLAFDGRAKIEHLVENDLYKTVICIPVLTGP